MNRRRFLKALGIGATAIVAAAKLPAALFRHEEPTGLFNGTVAFRGVPIVFDRHCPTNKIYFVNPKHFRAWDLRTGERLYGVRTWDTRH